jgi:HEAT repeat protein
MPAREPARAAAATSPASAAQALEARVNALIEALKEPNRRAAARAEIRKIGRDATPALLKRMRDPDFTVRWEMANVQGDIHDERAIPALVDNVIADPDAHIRWRSVWAIRECPDAVERLALPLLRAAQEWPDEMVRWNATVGLSMLGQRDVLPLIETGVNQVDDWRRWEAINALGRINGENSAQALAPVLERGIEEDRREAVLSLGHMRGEAAVTRLIAALGDPSSEVRWRAVMSLASIGNPRAREPIEQLQRGESNPLVLQHAARALKSLPLQGPAPPPAAAPPSSR